VRAAWLYAFGIAVATNAMISCSDSPETKVAGVRSGESLWRGWNKFQIKPADSLVRYGRELIENTSYYLGPKGIIKQISNGMNCQNCHLDGGTVPWGNNYGAVHATYPRYRDRSGTIESMEKRVNDCLERSLNGGTIDSLSKEMRAIVSYFHWVGSDVKKDSRPKGSGIVDLKLLDRPADPQRGHQVYIATCQRCHGESGEGQKNLTGYGYVYPPVWGANSYNTGAGLFRLSRLAGYVKNNMPFQEVDYSNPKLTDEEAWDVAAYINSQPRPVKENKMDWPDISKKPFDHPFGPYADTFSQAQHKYGPFAPIKKWKETSTKK
jgi:thiosulfate dehydrogenase